MNAAFAPRRNHPAGASTNECAPRTAARAIIAAAGVYFAAFTCSSQLFTLVSPLRKGSTVGATSGAKNTS